MNKEIQKLNINLDDETQMEQLCNIVDLYRAAQIIRQNALIFKQYYNMHPENAPLMLEEENKTREKQHNELHRLEKKVEQLEKQGDITEELINAKEELNSMMDIIDQESRFPFQVDIETIVVETHHALLSLKQTWTKVAPLTNVNFGKQITPSIIEFWNRIHKAWFPSSCNNSQPFHCIENKADNPINNIMKKNNITKNPITEEKLQKLTEFNRRMFNPTEEEKQQDRQRIEEENRRQEETLLYFDRHTFHPNLTREEHHKQYERFVERKKDHPNLNWGEFLEEYTWYYGVDEE